MKAMGKGLTFFVKWHISNVDHLTLNILVKQRNNFPYLTKLFPTHLMKK